MLLFYYNAWECNVSFDNTLGSKGSEGMKTTNEYLLLYCKYLLFKYNICIWLQTQILAQQTETVTYISSHYMYVISSAMHESQLTA